MKITIGPISLDILLFLRLCLPATVFIGLCTGIILAFGEILRDFIDQVAPQFIGEAWLLLLIVYIILGVAFTSLVARLIRRSSGSEDVRAQRRMVALSGLPFYALCLLFLLASVVSLLSPDMGAAAVYGSVGGFLLFGLVSGSYLLLLRFFLRRLTTNSLQLKQKENAF